MASFILKVIALALALSAFILNLLGNTDVETLVSLVTIGLFALALDAFMRR
jgi:hypothetical protein